MISSSTPSGTTLDLSTSSKIVVVSRIFGKFIYLIVYMVMKLIAASKSSKVLETEKLLIEIVTIGIPLSTYFSIVVLVDMRLASFPITWIVGGSFFLLLVLFIYNSLIYFVYIGIYLIDFNKGIFT